MRSFKEEQRFTQWWIWLLLLGINMIFFFGIYKQLVLKIPFGDNPMPNAGLIITTLCVFISTILFFTLKLKTRIDESGIYYRFYPIQSKFKIVSWDHLKSIRIIKFNPIMDYGGWGIKHNSYTVKGNKGFQLELKNGKKLLIGTQKENEVKQVLATYKSKIES